MKLSAWKYAIKERDIFSVFIVLVAFWVQVTWVTIPHRFQMVLLFLLLWLLGNIILIQAWMVLIISSRIDLISGEHYFVLQGLLEPRPLIQLLPLVVLGTTSWIQHLELVLGDPGLLVVGILWEGWTRFKDIWPEYNLSGSRGGF